MKNQEDKCIFLNMEVNVNNINSQSEHLGKIPRYYEDETFRLVRSIKLIKELKQIPIYIICFKEISEYNPSIMDSLKKLGVTILIPVLDEKIKTDINNFYSGFWYIPLTGLLMENTRKCNHFSSNYLVDQNGDTPNLPKYALKLDADMIMLNNPFESNEFKYSVKMDKPVCGYYDKDFGSDCKERTFWAIYDVQPMSNTCLMYTNLENDIYSKWYELLMKEDSDTNDLFEEVAFDYAWPYLTTIPFKNFQIGENYLDWNKLSFEEKQNIYFYHQKYNDTNREELIEIIFKLNKQIHDFKMNT